MSAAGTSRRSLFGITAAAALPFTATATQAPPHPDAALLAASAEFIRLQAIFDEIIGRPEGEDVPDDAFHTAYSAAMDVVTFTKATTSDGARAKAAAIAAYFCPDVFDVLDQCPATEMLWSLTQDLTDGAVA